MGITRREMERPFVIVSGLPGSGKTTLAGRLAPALGLPLIDKDDILERLFESEGTGDAVWRRKLSRQSDDLLRAEASASMGAVLSSFWHVPGMNGDSGTPTGWLFALSKVIVNVRCLCPAAVAATRFMNRQRHPGHLDSRRTYTEVLESIEVLDRLGPSSIGETIDVDTSRAVMPDVVVGEIRNVIERSLQRLGANES